MGVLTGIIGIMSARVHYEVAIGGRKYRAVKIGSLSWLAENLDYEWVGLGVGQEPSDTWQRANYYNDDADTYGIDGTRKCGLLYNWLAVQYLEQDKAMLLPEGWRVPTRADWLALERAIGASEFMSSVKAADDYASPGFPSEWNGTDTKRLAILPAGSRVGSSGYYTQVGNEARFWTITENSSARAYAPYLKKTSYSLDNYTDKNNQFSLRLCKG